MYSSSRSRSRSRSSAPCLTPRHPHRLHLPHILRPPSYRLPEPSAFHLPNFPYPPLHPVTCRKYRVLRRPVAIDHRTLPPPPHHRPHTVRRYHNPARQQLPHSSQTLQLTIHHLLEQPRRQPQRAHSLSLDKVSQLFQRRREPPIDAHLRPIQQSHPDLKRGRIKCHRRQQTAHVSFPHPERPLLSRQPHDRSLLHRYPLGFPRRSRCIDKIGQILRPYPHLRVLSAVSPDRLPILIQHYR